MRYITYNERVDLFGAHKGFQEGEEFKDTLLFGNVVLDLSTNGRIVGIELFNATDVLQVEAEVLLNLKDIEFTYTKEGQMLHIHVTLKTDIPTNREILFQDSYAEVEI